MFHHFPGFAAYDCNYGFIRACSVYAMNAQSPHPFVVRHPMSLGDAIAAMFRGKPKRKPLGMNAPALRPPFKTASSDELFSAPKQASRDSAQDRFTQLVGPH
jgi:hypothetical protein